MNSSKPSKSTKSALFPFREQEPFLGTDKRYYGYISGVGAGKTHAGVMRTAWNMEEWNEGEMGAIVAPTSTMVKDVIIPLMREVGLLETWDYKSAHTEEPGIHAPNGSRALILSADNRRTVERLAGLNLAWWWLDEQSRTPARAREILEQRLRVGEYRNGFGTTTPMGRDHTYDFYVGDHLDVGEWSEHGMADVFEAPDRLAITRVPTWANPFTAQDYKDQMQAKEGQVYDREVLGRFVDYEGLVYSWFNRESHVQSHEALLETLTETDDERRYWAIDRMIYGLDWGFSHPAAVVACAERDGQLYVLDELYETGLSMDALTQAVVDLQERWLPGPVFCDPSEPRGIDALRRRGVDAHKADNSVLSGIQEVSATDLVVSGTCDHLINEFGLYRYKDDSEDVIKQNDHAMDALRYAVMGRTDMGSQSVGVVGGDIQNRG